MRTHVIPGMPLAQRLRSATAIPSVRRALRAAWVALVVVEAWSCGWLLAWASTARGETAGPRFSWTEAPPDSVEPVPAALVAPRGQGSASSGARGTLGRALPEGNSDPLVWQTTLAALARQESAGAPAVAPAADEPSPGFSIEALPSEPPGAPSSELDGNGLPVAPQNAIVPTAPPAVDVPPPAGLDSTGVATTPLDAAAPTALGSAGGASATSLGAADDYGWQLLPAGLIYRSYAAGNWEPRLSTEWNHNRGEGWFWDLTLGGRQGLLRYGTVSNFLPQGWQLDIEGAAITRLDFQNERDVRATDYRAGMPLTYARGRYATKFAFYHLSSHLGDEFVIKNPTFPRLNYSHNGFVWGHSWYYSPDVRLYGEAGWAFETDGGAKPWEFQAGVDYLPFQPTGPRGAPFFAINGHVRQELNFSGNLVVQSGWMWRGGIAGRTLRMGMNYYNGKNRQLSLYQYFEQQVGMGIWYDY